MQLHCSKHKKFVENCIDCIDMSFCDPATILNDIRGSIARMDPETRHAVELYARTFRALAAQDPRVLMAIALIGAETAAGS